MEHCLSRRRAMLAPVAAWALLCLAGCGPSAGPSVVVYASVDQQFAEPVLDAFEAESGIDVQAVYDVEAAKTTGLVNRLIAEKDRPQADVWWSGEFAQTVDLAARGVLAPYVSPAAADIPPAYRDPVGAWTGFGGRARVLLVNTELLAPADFPDSFDDLVQPSIPGAQVGMAYPVFGTTATHAAALYAALGADAARERFQRIADAGVRIVDGNGVVRDLVVAGDLAFGITDTDDACGAIERGAPVEIVVPDQAAGQPGTLVIPNTVGLVAGAPHPDQARALIDRLLDAETERQLLASGWFQLSLRGDPPAGGCDVGPVRGMDVGLLEVAEFIEPAKADMAEIFVR